MEGGLMLQQRVGGRLTFLENGVREQGKTLKRLSGPAGVDHLGKALGGSFHKDEYLATSGIIQGVHLWEHSSRR